MGPMMMDIGRCDFVEMVAVGVAVPVIAVIVRVVEIVGVEVVGMLGAEFVGMVGIDGVLYELIHTHFRTWPHTIPPL